MVCSTEDAVKQIRRLGDNAYGLRMVLLSIAQTHPNLVVEAVNNIKVWPDDIEALVIEVWRNRGKVPAITHYMKETGATLDHAHKRVMEITNDNST